ncbi:MAG: CPBP family glutamic-type intramembrane protease [Promethearchaeota archaeon]
MAITINDIRDVYWPKIWKDERNTAEIEKELAKANRKAKVKVYVLAAILLLFFVVPFPIPFRDGMTRWVSICQFLVSDAYYLDSSFSGWDSYEGSLDPPAYSLDQYIYLFEFIWKWIGISGATCLIYWALFMSPFDKLKGKNTRKYIEEVIYDEPKNPMAFIKTSIKDQKYRWLGFFYTWSVGFIISCLIDITQWDWISQHHAYVTWFDQPVGNMPVFLIMLIFINFIFAILIGSAKPRTKSGQRKKTAALALIGACIFAAVVLAVLNSAAINDYIQNFNTYSVRFPKDPASTLPEIYVNYNLLFWTLGLVFSLFPALLFLLVLNAYQNKKIKIVIEQRFRNVIEVDDNPWEYKSLAKRHENDIRRKKFISRFSALELIFFFGLFLFTLWGLYFYWGQLKGNVTSQNVAIGILAFELVWAIGISPIIHFKMEKGITYKGKRATFVYSEDRGIGSWRKYWSIWLKKRLKLMTPEERKKAAAFRNFVWIFLGIMILWICGAGMGEDAVVGFFPDIFKAIGLDTIPDNDVKSMFIGFFAILYAIVAPVVLLFSLKVMRFNNLRDPDRGKKRLYSVLFIIFLAGLNLGIIDVVNRQFTEISFLLGSGFVNILATTGVSVLLVFIVGLGLWALCFPFFLRFDDLFESIPDLVKLLAFGSIFLPTWNWMCEWLLTDPRLHWSWNSDTPQVLRDSFLIGDFFYGVAGYWYWGWVQELLFLGYFCWLSYKIQPNKWINAGISSLLFMMFHWDNIALMVGTALGGFMWALWFDKRRNLAILGWMHGYNGQLVNMLIPMSMTVGPGAH